MADATTPPIIWFKGLGQCCTANLHQLIDGAARSGYNYRPNDHMICRGPNHTTVITIKATPDGWHRA